MLIISDPRSSGEQALRAWIFWMISGIIRFMRIPQYVEFRHSVTKELVFVTLTGVWACFATLCLATSTYDIFLFTGVGGSVGLGAFFHS